MICKNFKDKEKNASRSAATILDRLCTVFLAGFGMSTSEIDEAGGELMTAMSQKYVRVIVQGIEFFHSHVCL